MKVNQPYRSPGEYQPYLAGVKATAALFGYSVDAESWGGGLPKDLTLLAEDMVPTPPVTEPEAASAPIADATTEPDSAWPETDSESVSST